MSHQIRYDKLAEAVGGKGYFVQTAEELRKATVEGFKATVPVIINVVLDSGRMENNVVSLGQRITQFREMLTSTVLLMADGNGTKS